MDDFTVNMTDYKGKFQKGNRKVEKEVCNFSVMLALSLGNITFYLKPGQDN